MIPAKPLPAPDSRTALSGTLHMLLSLSTLSLSTYYFTVILFTAYCLLTSISTLPHFQSYRQLSLFLIIILLLPNVKTEFMISKNFRMPDYRFRTLQILCIIPVVVNAMFQPVLSTLHSLQGEVPPMLPPPFALDSSCKAYIIPQHTHVISYHSCQ